MSGKNTTEDIIYKVQTNLTANVKPLLTNSKRNKQNNKLTQSFSHASLFFLFSYSYRIVLKTCSEWKLYPTRKMSFDLHFHLSNDQKKMSSVLSITIRVPPFFNILTKFNHKRSEVYIFEKYDSDIVWVFYSNTVKILLTKIGTG